MLEPLTRTTVVHPHAGPVLAIAQALELLLLQHRRKQSELLGDELIETKAIAAELLMLYETTLPSLDALHARFYECEAARLQNLLIGVPV